MLHEPGWHGRFTAAAGAIWIAGEPRASNSSALKPLHVCLPIEEALRYSPASSRMIALVSAGKSFSSIQRR